MKGFKKLLTGILAATMIMGASITAFATEGSTNTASITINNDGNNNEGAIAEITYTYYQFLKADIRSLSNGEGENNAEQSGTVAYYVENETLAGLFENAKDAAGKNLFTVDKSNTEKRWNVSATDAATAENIVAVLDTKAFKDAAIKTDTFSNKVNEVVNASATVDGLEPGYYLVLSSLGTKAALQTIGNVEIKEKNTYPTVSKDKVPETDTFAMLGIGSKLSYEIKVNIPANAAEEDITVVDTATNGLTFELEADKITVKGATGLTNLSWTQTGEGKVDDKAATVYKTVIPASVVANNRGKEVTLSYNAVINETAVIYVDEENTAHIEYGEYNSAETEPVKVKTIGFKIFKYTKEGETEVALSGAKFKLYDKNNQEIKLVQVVVDGKPEEGHYRVATAAEIAANKAVEIEVIADGAQKGYATIDGLEFGKYFLEETVAPAGYNKLTDKHEFSIDSNLYSTSIMTEKVFNNSGSVLPSTGGVGTTIFYIIGGILIIAGVAYFLVRRKADAE